MTLCLTCHYTLRAQTTVAEAPAPLSSTRFRPKSIGEKAAEMRRSHESGKPAKSAKSAKSAKPASKPASRLDAGTPGKPHVSPGGGKGGEGRGTGGAKHAAAKRSAPAARRELHGADLSA